MATVMPLGVGAAFAIGWWVMALVTVFFICASAYQLVRPGHAIRP